MFTLSQLKENYKFLLDSCEIKETWRSRVEEVVKNIKQHEEIYRKVARELGWEDFWYFIGGLHNLESSLDFGKHLHNGDPLTQQTYRIPAGRPIHPPRQGWSKGYTWEESALDALLLKNFQDIKDRSLEAWLWRGELYNGFGYQMLNKPNPYLWSGTNHYHQGKFVADGKYDPNAVSQQVGLACILKAFQSKTLLEKPGLLRVVGDRASGFTWAKQSTQQNYLLPESEKTRVPINTTLEFTHYLSQEQHYLVQLNCLLKSEDSSRSTEAWFFFQDHVELELQRSSLELTLAEKVVKVCRDRNFPLDERSGAINIIGLEGVNLDGTPNEDTPDHYNDLVGILRIDKGKPYFDCLFKATTEPGKYYSLVKLLNPLGCARLQLGHHPNLWEVGIHRGYQALVQSNSPVRLVRDRNRNFLRDDVETVEYSNGINLHHGNNSAVVGRHSAGCVVISSRLDFQAFLEVCKRSLQHKERSKFSFTLLWRDWL